MGAFCSWCFYQEDLDLTEYVFGIRARALRAVSFIVPGHKEKKKNMLEFW